MLTYQDFIAATDAVAFVAEAISQHMASEEYRTARDADLYDRQRNVTINRLVNAVAGKGATNDYNGEKTNMRLASNWFNRFNTQRCSYLLGNGVTFDVLEQRVNEKGILIEVDATKEKLGSDYDNALNDWGYYALIHGVSFGFWNVDRLFVFKLTEFVPLWDENTGALRAGIRFWRLAPNKPMIAVLYTEKGYTTFHTRDRSAGMDFVTDDEKPQPYLEKVQATEARGETVVGADSYGALPIIPMWGSRKKQSTLIGFREKIDAYDLISSGFANDQHDCSKIYWLLENCGGMSKKEMDEFLEDIKTRHIANVYTDSFNGDARAALTPYTQEVPYQGNQAVLDMLEKSMYRDFGALDEQSISAGSTNDHIDAAYQPLDEEADQFEVQVIKAIQQQLALMGIEATPSFKRNRVSNVKETVEAVMLCANYLDPEAVLSHIPFITVDEKAAILQRMDNENAERLALEIKGTGNREQGTGENRETGGEV